MTLSPRTGFFSLVLNFPWDVLCFSSYGEQPKLSQRYSVTQAPSLSNHQINIFKSTLICVVMMPSFYSFWTAHVHPVDCKAVGYLGLQ